MVRIVCKVFKKRRVVCTQKSIISALLLRAGLYGWNVAEAGHKPAEVALQYRDLAQVLLTSQNNNNNKNPNQTNKLPKQQQQNNSDQQKLHIRTPQKNKNKLQFLQTLGVCQTNAVLKAFFFPHIYLLFLFTKKCLKLPEARNQAFLFSLSNCI